VITYDYQQFQSYLSVRSSGLSVTERIR
jgi:hypothetical protein